MNKTIANLENIIKSFKDFSKAIHRAEDTIRKAKLNIDGFKVGTKFRLSNGLCHIIDIVDIDAGLDWEIIIFKWWDYSEKIWKFSRDRLWNLKTRIARKKKGIK